MSQIFNCLEEWESGSQKKISFKGELYSSAHDAILDLIEKVKFDEYHGPKFATLRCKWAKKGM
jgi:hypothetical protein